MIFKYFDKKMAKMAGFDSKAASLFWIKTFLKKKTPIFVAKKCRKSPKIVVTLLPSTNIYITLFVRVQGWNLSFVYVSVALLLVGAQL
jgi:hypothetical protein